MILHQAHRLNQRANIYFHSIESCIRYIERVESKSVTEESVRIYRLKFPCIRDGYLLYFHGDTKKGT